MRRARAGGVRRRLYAKKGRSVVAMVNYRDYSGVDADQARWAYACRCAT